MILAGIHTKQGKGMRILITGARSYPAYYWALALRGQHTIHFADSLHTSFCRFAPFESRFHLIAGPAVDARQFRDDIRCIVQQLSIELIIPTCEEVFYLSRFMDELPCQVFCPPHDLLAKLHNKSSVFDCIPQAGGILKPITKLVTRPDDIMLDLESIMKPVFSRFGAQVIMDARKDGATALNGTDHWVQQQRLEGKSLCNYAIAINGKLLAHSVYHAKSRIKNSAALHMASVERPDIEAFTQAFVLDHGYTGQVAFDFIETAEGVYVIECNPRATSGIFFLCLEDLGEAIVSQKTVGRASHKEVAFKQIMRLYSALSLLNKEDDCQKAEVGQVMDVLAAPGYPMPGRIASVALLELAWRRIRHGLKLTEASTHDIEWNGNPISF